MSLRIVIENLIRRIREKKSMLIAFSGGVDSSVLAFLARQALGDKALAVTIKSPLLPPGELEEAIMMAKWIGIEHVIIELNELEIPGFSNNPRNRCYLCKKFRFSKLKEIAMRKGFNVVADGTNKSDLSEYRPGLKAAIEEGIYSPFLEAGLSKEDIRKIARHLNLPVYDKPPSSCLATRIPYGENITLERLRRIGLAEKAIKELLGISMVRVRDHGDIARIEVYRGDRKLFFNDEALEIIVNELKRLGFKFVTLDLEGYKSGCFDY